MGSRDDSVGIDDSSTTVGSVVEEEGNLVRELPGGSGRTTNDLNAEVILRSSLRRRGSDCKRREREKDVLGLHDGEERRSKG